MMWQSFICYFHASPSHEADLLVCTISDIFFPRHSTDDALSPTPKSERGKTEGKEEGQGEATRAKVDDIPSFSSASPSATEGSSLQGEKPALEPTPPSPIDEQSTPSAPSSYCQKEASFSGKHVGSSLHSEGLNEGKSAALDQTVGHALGQRAQDQLTDQQSELSPSSMKWEKLNNALAQSKRLSNQLSRSVKANKSLSLRLREAEQKMKGSRMSPEEAHLSQLDAKVGALVEENRELRGRLNQQQEQILRSSLYQPNVEHLLITILTQLALLREQSVCQRPMDHEVLPHSVADQVATAIEEQRSAHLQTSTQISKLYTMLSARQNDKQTDKNNQACVNQGLQEQVNILARAVKSLSRGQKHQLDSSQFKSDPCPHSKPAGLNFDSDTDPSATIEPHVPHAQGQNEPSVRLPSIILSTDYAPKTAETDARARCNARCAAVASTKLEPPVGVHKSIPNVNSASSEMTSINANKTDVNAKTPAFHSSGSQAPSPEGCSTVFKDGFKEEEMKFMECFVDDMLSYSDSSLAEPNPHPTIEMYARTKKEQHEGDHSTEDPVEGMQRSKGHQHRAQERLSRVQQKDQNVWGSSKACHPFEQQTLDQHFVMYSKGSERTGAEAENLDRTMGDSESCATSFALRSATSRQKDWSEGSRHGSMPAESLDLDLSGLSATMQLPSIGARSSAKAGGAKPSSMVKDEGACSQQGSRNSSGGLAEFPETDDRNTESEAFFQSSNEGEFRHNVEQFELVSRPSSTDTLSSRDFGI